MGYDYVIRVSIDSLDGLTKDKLLEAYEKFKNSGNANFYFGCEGHGGSGWLSCGGLNKYLEKLFTFTQEFPNKTFTFYNHYFDYFSFEKIVVKDKNVLSNENFANFDVDPSSSKGKQRIKKSISECKNHGIIFRDTEDLENVHLPTNMRIDNELSGLFSNKEDSMSGGFCFGPSCENVNGFLHYLFLETIKLE